MSEEGLKEVRRCVGSEVWVSADQLRHPPPTPSFYRNLQGSLELALDFLLLYSYAGTLDLIRRPEISLILLGQYTLIHLLQTYFELVNQHI
jgi:hypothetical protein